MAEEKRQGGVSKEEPESSAEAEIKDKTAEEKGSEFYSEISHKEEISSTELKEGSERAGEERTMEGETSESEMGMEEEEY